jgi:hypothetical protein
MHNRCLQQSHLSKARAVQCRSNENHTSISTSRRPILLGLGALASILHVKPGEASILPKVADQAWEAIGGGPSDLYFPTSFLGTFDVSSLLVDISTPLGPAFVMNPSSLERARRDDLGKTARYQCRWIQSDDGIIFDRAFNTASLLSMYYQAEEGWGDRIDWDYKNPNIATVRLPGGAAIRTRVTRRSSSADIEQQRLETSEYIEQIFSDDLGSPPRIKASQCFTKYKFRDEVGGPDDVSIVASQVVADFLTPYDNEMLYAQAMNKPVVKYFYRINFRRVDK